MKLQSKVILITAITWIIICIVIFIDAKLTVNRAYMFLENELIKKDIQDTQNAYDKMLATLVLYSQAFSQWDDAYHFMNDKNKKFITSNFVSGTYTSSHINFMMYYDTNKKLYYGQEYAFAKNLLLPLPNSLIEYLKNNSSFLSHKNEMDNKVGILNTSDGLIVMSSLPVLTSEGVGPSRGSLLMGYYLTNREFNNLSDVVGMKLSFFPLSIVHQDSLINLEFKKLSAKSKISQVAINENIAYGSILLTDINDKPVGILRIEVPRYIYLQGLSTYYHYFSIVIILGLIVMLLNWYLLKMFVIDRVISISNQVTKINMNNNFKKMLSISGNDELETMINSINNMISIITYSQERLLYLATHDDLTHLPNRKYFYDLLNQEMISAKKNHVKLAILFINVDKFKDVNDQYGHEVGDKFLIYIADRIKHSIKDTDILARLSGDEFILCLKNIKKIDDVIQSSKRIINSAHTGFDINHSKIFITLSIGISIYPDDGTTIEDLLRKADKMMYSIKEKSGNNFEFYNHSMLVDKS